MKKVLILAVAACLIGSGVNAQDVYKQTGGEQNIEVLFAPFGGSPISIGGIKYRKFTSATTAWRAEVFLGYSSNTTITGETPEGTELRDRSSSFDVVISPGMEWHLPGTDRLSPYYGGVLNLGFNSSSNRTEFVPVNEVEENTTTNGSIGVGLAAVGGFDYYFAHNIYLGAEIGFGFNLRSDSDTKISSTIDGVEDESFPNGGGFDIGPLVQARLRLGILF